VVQAGPGSVGQGHDINEAVLAATNLQIDQEGALQSTLTLSLACENLPNMDQHSLTDALCVLYQI